MASPFSLRTGATTLLPLMTRRINAIVVARRFGSRDLVAVQTLGMARCSESMVGIAMRWMFAAMVVRWRYVIS